MTEFSTAGDGLSDVEARLAVWPVSHTHMDVIWAPSKWVSVLNHLHKASVTKKNTQRVNYFASSNPHPPHSRAFDRYNKFLCILETSTPNSHRPLPFPSATSTCLRADLKNSNIGSVNKSQAPSKKKPDGGLYKRSCLFTTQSNTTPFRASGYTQTTKAPT